MSKIISLRNYNFHSPVFSSELFVDVGDKRLGIAFGDDLHDTAFGNTFGNQVFFDFLGTLEAYPFVCRTASDVTGVTVNGYSDAGIPL